MMEDFIEFFLALIIIVFQAACFLPVSWVLILCLNTFANTHILVSFYHVFLFGLGLFFVANLVKRG